MEIIDFSTELKKVFCLRNPTIREEEISVRPIIPSDIGLDDWSYLSNKISVSAIVPSVVAICIFGIYSGTNELEVDIYDYRSTTRQMIFISNVFSPKAVVFPQDHCFSLKVKPLYSDNVDSEKFSYRFIGLTAEPNGCQTLQNNWYSQKELENTYNICNTCKNYKKRK